MGGKDHVQGINLKVVREVEETMAVHALEAVQRDFETGLQTEEDEDRNYGRLVYLRMKQQQCVVGFELNKQLQDEYDEKLRRRRDDMERQEKEEEARSMEEGKRLMQEERALQEEYAAKEKQWLGTQDKVDETEKLREVEAKWNRVQQAQHDTEAYEEEVNRSKGRLARMMGRVTSTAEMLEREKGREKERQDAIDKHNARMAYFQKQMEENDHEFELLLGQHEWSHMVAQRMQEVTEQEKLLLDEWSRVEAVRSKELAAIAEQKHELNAAKEKQLRLKRAFVDLYPVLTKACRQHGLHLEQYPEWAAFTNAAQELGATMPAVGYGKMDDPRTVSVSGREWCPPWTRPEDNRLRELQGKEKKGTLGIAERVELADLQERSDRFINAGLKSMEGAVQPSMEEQRHKKLSLVVRRLCWDLLINKLRERLQNEATQGVAASIVSILASLLELGEEGEAVQEIKARTGALRLGGVEEAKKAIDSYRAMLEDRHKVSIGVVQSSEGVEQVCRLSVRWSRQFPAELTSEQPFYRIGKAPVPVQLMHGRGVFLYCETDEFQAVSLRLCCGLDALVLLPRFNADMIKTMLDVLQGLAAKGWEEIGNDAFKKVEGDFWLPRGKIKGCGPMRDALQECGCEHLTKTVVDKSEYVLTEIGVNAEEGCEGCDEPELTMNCGKRFEMRCDRPFVWILREPEFSVPIVASVVGCVEPAARVKMVEQSADPLPADTLFTNTSPAVSPSHESPQAHRPVVSGVFAIDASEAIDDFLKSPTPEPTVACRKGRRGDRGSGVFPFVKTASLGEVGRSESGSGSGKGVFAFANAATTPPPEDARRSSGFSFINGATTPPDTPSPPLANNSMVEQDFEAVFRSGDRRTSPPSVPPPVPAPKHDILDLFDAPEAPHEVCLLTQQQQVQAELEKLEKQLNVLKQQRDEKQFADLWAQPRY